MEDEDGVAQLVGLQVGVPDERAPRRARCGRKRDTIAMGPRGRAASRSSLFCRRVRRVVRGEWVPFEFKKLSRERTA